jgi:hypothetical protein
MAAATTVISAGIALAGVGLSVNQAVQADKERKQAQQAATAAANRMKNIKEENAFKDIEMPTLGFELAQQSADRQMMAGIQTAQGAGAEAVIGALPGMMQVGAEQQLQLASMGNQAQMDLALQKAQAQQGVNFREAQAQRDFTESQLTGAQLAASSAEANKQAAIMSAVQSAGTAVNIAGKGVDAYKMQNGTEGVTAGSAAKQVGFTGNRGTVQTTPTPAIPQQQQYASGLTPEQMRYLSAFRYF